MLWLATRDHGHGYRMDGGWRSRDSWFLDRGFLVCCVLCFCSVVNIQPVSCFMPVSAVVPVLVTATTTLLKLKSERSDGDVTSVSVRHESETSTLAKGK